MDPDAALAAATSTISSRFESQTSIDEAKENKLKEWKEAYARIGQEPPPEEPDQEYDPRTLFERLQSQKDTKKEEWDSKMKLSNQWRGLDSEEQRFLAEKEAEKRAEQRKVEEREADEVREYRERLAAKHASQATVEAPAIASSSSSASKKVPPKPARKDVKSLMKGIVVKKKPKAVTTSTVTKATSTGTSVEPKSAGLKREAPDSADEIAEEKRLKVGKEETSPMPST
ncbi:hypothetical protein CI109_105551 [Kwoniella shandongensis]|uniref:Uncharacterized protein n=1 Tax=Kwoniella shandongensis TaxID=1734106 RepID=A0A5M6C7E2_9TREE|nr:uncharacterized protein CI109_002268 [Kwoniella shandongensis]KAA5529375.1 hypothetical protein CI109_002268 [Kwoniella shandongensis]